MCQHLSGGCVVSSQKPLRGTPLADREDQNHLFVLWSWMSGNRPLPQGEVSADHVGCRGGREQRQPMRQRPLWFGLCEFAGQTDGALGQRRKGQPGGHNVGSCSGSNSGELQADTQGSGPGAFATLASAKCTNEENYLFQKFARAVLGTNNVDHCARSVSYTHLRAHE